jgi:hypothetical protein
VLYFEKNLKLGYYTVGQKVYHNKLQALTAPDNQHFPHWHFNDQIFDAVDWTQEPDIDIEVLYAQRARQLREQYDYIVLFFSGGADSSTVLNSFLLNDLTVDEVVVGHPESGLNHWTGSRATALASLTVNEYYYTVVPQLKELQKSHPHTRITINDYFQDMVTAYQSDQWIESARDYFHPSFVSRYSKKNLAHVKAVCESGKRVAFVYGVDKPRLAIIDGKYHCYFLDIIANTSTWDIESYENAVTEFFYWTPDFPLLPVKQAHLVANWLDTPEAKKFRSVVNWPPQNYEQNQRLKTIYDRSIRQPLYPRWNFDWFQTHKSTSCISAEQDDWFFQNHTNTAMYDVWRAGIDHLIRWVPPRFLQTDSQGTVQGLVGFISPMRALRAIV